ncbi:hypothetical protein SYNPS1DRAFT_9176, partial [Syncephalis pseudoplumigaleata]
ERTVVLMTARVAQKSYGAEKRFLCPPPTVMLLGSQWWTTAPGYDQHGQTDFNYHPPKVTIHIPGDSGDQTGALEWCNAAGQPVLEGGGIGGGGGVSSGSASAESLPVAGRCVAKHLYINDADEKRKRVEISVRIQTASGHQVGKFDSRPIKVISKPSKKRQSIKNLELCIHHGTTVSLFNRVRSQTVSTKYLGVSSNATTQRWHCPGTFNPSTANAGDAAACFVARTDGWDPFVIWLVEPDPLKRDQQQLLHEQTGEMEATPIGYPPPPGVAMHPRRHLIPVHYNQLVVLQCLTTGMVSPVMRVRKVEKGSMVTGGAEITSLGDGSEMLGDPVSQLHKVAFEIYQPKPAATAPSSSAPNAAESLEEAAMFGSAMALQGFDPTPGTYLACLGDVVGVHPALDGTKRLSSPPHTPKTPVLAQQHPATTTGQSAADSPQDTATRDAGSVTSSVPGSPLWPQSHSASSSSTALSGTGASWHEDVGDASVWTIVGTECVRYTFFHPSSVDANQPRPNDPTAHAFSFQPQVATTPLVLLSGENLTPDLSVWFGDRCSIQTEWRSRELLACYGPEPLASDNNGPSANAERREVPLLLVKSDGIIY